MNMKIKKKKIKTVKYDDSREISTDPQGSYTGKPTDGTEIPVQDADDL